MKLRKIGVSMEIQVLDEQTIDKIAAGEVVEKPFSVVKELVENAIDSGATMITVEIKEGGCSFIRITDNGCGIDKKQVSTAFLRHATSKIRQIDDLIGITSLGFRGEALSSIAAVGQVELVTKRKEDITGLRYVIEGSKEKSSDEVGAPDGTTIIVRNLFYNTPARRKFLKTPTTEGSYITDFMEHVMLSHPEVSFSYIMNGHCKLQTSGNNDLKEVIYKIYGRDIIKELIPIAAEESGFSITGFLTNPIVARSNRSYECYFINGRYVKSTVIAKAIEQAYEPFLMKHKYPFTILNFSFAGGMLDVNVHPTKMDVRFSDEKLVFDFIYSHTEKALNRKEFIPDVELDSANKRELPESKKKEEITQPEPFEVHRIEQEKIVDNTITPAIEPVEISTTLPPSNLSVASGYPQADLLKETSEYKIQAPEQLNLFEEHILTKKKRDEYKIIGQIFKTYWIIEYQDQVLYIDQHAAHEKVIYERFMRRYQNNEITSQQLNPPLILTLTGKEENVLTKYIDSFTTLGFEIEPFGSNEYTIRAIPEDLCGIGGKELFLEMLDDLSEGIAKDKTPESIRNRIATMSCKAAVKGNNHLSTAEIEALIDELLELDNPYHCPHGRPTIISMTKQELEKKFKRIVD